MTKRNRIFLSGLALLFAASLTLTACTDEFLSVTPPHIIVVDNLYQDAAGFEAGINALYSEVRRERRGGSGANQLNSIMWSIGVDNAFGNYPASIERLFNDWGSRNHSQEGTYADTWNWMYRTINNANTIIGRSENPDIDWTEAEKNRIVAEARLIRAWAYRHLTYLWGDVPMPLVESSGTSIITDWTRTPVAEVREQMEQDLLYAEQYLPEVPSADGKVGKAVAQHYLSELYLAMGEPAKAEEKAKAVINSGNYKLITERYGVRRNEPGVPFMDMFYEGNTNRSQGNTEALWVLQLEKDVIGGGDAIMRRYWVNRYYSLRGLQVSPEYGGRGIGRWSPTGWALSIYEPNDDRGSEYAIRWFYKMNNPGTVPPGYAVGDTLWLRWSANGEKLQDPWWPSTAKWDYVDPIDPEGEYNYEDQVYLRLAETYLLLAEAQWAQGKSAEAAETINVLRRRANASEITAADVTLDFILDERSRELLTEEQRRHTLVRTGKWLERVKKYNSLASPYVTERDILFPIPQVVIDANLNAPMPQNPGY